MEVAQALSMNMYSFVSLDYLFCAYQVHISYGTISHEFLKTRFNQPWLQGEYLVFETKEPRSGHS